MAVYTHLTSEDIAEILRAYPVGELVSSLGIAEGVENSNYLVVTEDEAGERKYILTIFEKRVDPHDLPFFIGLKEHLAQKGIPCPLPIRTHAGEAIGQLQDGKYFALVSFLSGRSMRQVTAQHLKELGETVAHMHLAAKDFTLKRPNTLSLAGWRKLFERSAEGADVHFPGLKEAVMEELHFLMSAWPSPQELPGGVIHADIFPDNVFFRDGHLSGIIDFYFACNDAWMYDLTIMLNAWCFEADGSFNVTKARYLLAGYQSVRRLNDAEMRYLPVLARGAALRFLLTRLYDYINTVEGAMVQVKDPMEYYRKLQFHQSIKGYAAYGL